MKMCLKCIKYILCAVCCYVLLLTLVFLIPDKGIQGHREEALSYIEEEGEYPKPFFESASARLDNVTDHIMIQKTQPESENVLISAMNPTYARYWHGYLVFLRPLLLFFDYFQIRFLGYCVSTTLLFLLFGLVLKHEGWGVSMALAASAILVRFIVVPVSLQFASSFNVMLIFCIWVLWKRENQDWGNSAGRSICNSRICCKLFRLSYRSISYLRGSSGALHFDSNEKREKFMEE